jgi:hypothetical protein
MLIDAKTIQALIDRQVALDRQSKLVMRYRNAGDEAAARFHELPAQQQATLLAKQDVTDAVGAARVGDRDGVQQAVTSAVNRVIFQGADLGNVRQQRQIPRRKRGR